MSLQLSTGLRNAMLGEVGNAPAVIVGATLAYVDGGAGVDSITDSGSGFVTAGFKTGMVIKTQGSTTGANDGTYTVLSVAAGTMTFATGSFDTAEAFPAGGVIIGSDGGSFKDVMKDGIIRIYSGAQPTDSDDAETGTLLATITVASGAHTPGSESAGLEFGAASAGVIAKDSGVWSGVAVATGTAGWFRFYDNAVGTGASESYKRFDGAVATSGGQLNMSSTSITLGATVTLDTFQITLPATP